MHLDRASLPHLAACLLFSGIATPFYAAAADTQTLANAQSGANAGPPRLGGPTAEGIEFFETHIRPVLVAKCYECHSAKAKSLKAGLRLDSAERMRAGGESGPAIVPNKPDESLLVSALRYESNEMPPSGKLPDAVINDFAKWIAIGAPDPRTENGAVDTQ